MAKRFLLLLLLLAGLLGAMPSLRGRTAAYLRPAARQVDSLAAPALRRVLDPVLRWSTRKEEVQYLARLRSRVNVGEALPQPSEFTAFAARSTASSRGGLDRWGSPYYLVVTADSIRVGSPGPDAKRGTDDDVIASAPRRCGG